MQIRKMTMEDYSDVYQLWTNTPGMGLRSLDDSQEGIANFLKRNPETNFVAQVKGGIAGVILSGHDGRRGTIYHTAVDNAYRRSGIGKALVEAAITALKEQGIHKASLVAFRTNELGNAFWEAVGFTERTDLVYRNKSLNEDNI